MTFPCTGCGACCRRIAGIPEIANYDRGDGTCQHLTNDNACAIYEFRPRVCRVDEMCSPVLAPAEWYRRNAEACERIHLAVYGQPLVR